MNETIINLTGDVGWEITADVLRDQLPESGDVVLNVNSPGGFVFDGFEIYNVIEDYKGGKVNVIINGLAASAASYFIMAADKITRRSNSVFMAHKAWALTWGDADEMQTQSNILNGIDSVLASAYVKKTGREKDIILSEMKDEIWLFGEEIEKAGFADDSYEDISKDLEIMDDIKNKAFAKVESTKNRVNNYFQKNQEWKDRAAAFLKNSSTIGEIKKPVEENKTIKNQEVSKMDLEEFLKQNPEAQAEIDSSINSAIASERERINEIVNLSGVVASDEMNEAISAGTDSGVYAKAQLLAENVKRKQVQNSQDFGKIDKPVTLPSDSMEAPKNDLIDTEEKAKAAAKKLFNK